MDDLGGPRYKRIKLTGARFEGGRLPIDSLVELERYQRAVQLIAEHAWRREHPGEVPPAEVTEAASLAIERIEEGSADIFLAFEQSAAYQAYTIEAQDAVDSTVEAAYLGLELPSLPDDVGDEVRETLAEMGETLQSGQSMQFYVDDQSIGAIEINVETRPAATERLILSTFLQEPAPKADSGIHREETSLVARVTVIDAEHMKYELNSEAYGVIHGRYRDNPEILDALREVVNSTSDGPLTRIFGELRHKSNKPWSFWTTTKIERVQFDDSDWGRSLARYATLPTGWAGGYGVQISSIALDATQALMRLIGAGAQSPAIAPTEDGGVLLEWADDIGIRSVEILEDGTFELFSMSRHEHRGRQTETVDASKAAAFAKGSDV